jgi:hypothetical protein
MRGLRLLSIGVLIVVAAALLLRMLVVKIEPGTTGVVNAEWTGGLVEKDFGPGYHWSVGPLHTWSIYDTTVQTLHMVRDQNQGHGDVYHALQVKSKEGADVTLDVTLKYRISAGKAWLVRKDQGPGDKYKRLVSNLARDVMRVALGGLQTEAFYKATDRKAVAAAMEAALRQRLAEIHVELVSILIRDLEFDPRFQERIKEKTLASQQIELNKARSRAAEARGKTNKIEAESEAKVVVINQQKEKTLITLRAENDKKIQAITADYRKAVTEIKSDADLYAAVKEAEGVKLLKEAEARGQTLRRDALAGAGGSMLVALELVRNLNLGEMVLSTQAMNPLDVETLLDQLGANGK